MFPLIRGRPERATTRANPFWDLREEMETLFDRLFEGRPAPVEWAEMREWEIVENDNEVVMRLEIPGFEAAEIELRTAANVFVLRAEHAAGNEGEKNGHRHVERVEYRFMLPVGTDANRIEATYRNGVLEMHLPRLPEAMPRRVEVKT